MKRSYSCFKVAMMFTFSFVALIAGVFHLYAQNSKSNGRLIYPNTKQVDQVDEYHGIQVQDPFRWLENMASEETQQWINAQDELTGKFLEAVPTRAVLHKRISELWHFDLYTIPAKANGRYFYTKTPAGKSQPVLYVQETRNQKPRMLLDLSRHLNDADAKITGYWPSPDGRQVAYAIVKGQSSWRRLRIIEVESGNDHSHELAGLHNLGGGIAWTQEGKGFYYVRFAVPSPGNEMQAVVENPQIYYHRVGTPQSEDQFVYATPEKSKTVFTVQTTTDGHYLIITAREGSKTENDIYYQALHFTPAKIETLLHADAAYTFLGNEGSRFWIYSDLNAPRGRVVVIDLAQPQRAHWTEVIPEAAETIAGGSLVGGNALGFFGNRLVIMYIKDNRPVVKIFDRHGRVQKHVNLPGSGSIWGGFSGQQNEREVFYQFLGQTDPSSIHVLNVETGKYAIFRRSELRLDPDHFESKQVFYQSKDGTRVPMFVSHKKGMHLNGSNPTFIYGYGAFGWSSFLWYQPQVIAWMEMGGVYAVAGIRGGGEYGEAWHQAGMKHNKQNAIDDYLAAAEWLIVNKYTSPSQLAANGGSASGAVAGAAILQRPDLFGAAVIDRPALDMIRFEKFTSAGHWIHEFGSAQNPDEFKTLYAYSPYHNIKRGQCYPPALIMVGDRDQVTVPLHAYKFVAALQTAQGCNNPALLKMMWGAGHNFGATPAQIIDSLTDEMAFLVAALKMQTTK